MTDRPVCVCHGEPMYKHGTGWRCKIRQRGYEQRYARSEKGRASSVRRNARYHAHPHVQAEKRLRELLRSRVRIPY